MRKVIKGGTNVRETIFEDENYIRKLIERG